MGRYIGQCDRCKKEFRAGPRNKLAMLHEQPRSTKYGHDTFARYYCDECAEEVKKAVRRFEMEGR